MINLLPPDVKQQYIYARRSQKLRKWISGAMIGLLGVLIIVGFGFIAIHNEAESYNTQIAQSKQLLEAKKLNETKQEVENVTSSLKLVVQVLSKQILFSELLQQIGNSMPRGSILTGLGINQVEGGIDLQAKATNYQTATQVQINLSDPNNKIFDQADIVRVSCAEADSEEEDSALSASYPCTINIRAQFSKDNGFLLINNADKTAQGATP